MIPVISAVAVVVPARDEQDHIEPCLRSIQQALERLPADIATTLTVVLDRCGDATPHRVEALLRGWPGGRALRVTALGCPQAGICAGPEPAHLLTGHGVGAIRDLGIRDALTRLSPYPRANTWILNTDADTTVGPDWARQHLQLANAGAGGVAGLADLSDPAALSARARRRYRVILGHSLDEFTHRDDPDGQAHGHVYGANLGVRADAYLAVGGFPSDGPGEDHGLWQRLRTAGYRLAAPRDVRVRTSARTHGRANGGLADLLHALHTEPDNHLHRITPAAGQG